MSGLEKCSKLVFLAMILIVLLKDISAEQQQKLERMKMKKEMFMAERVKGGKGLRNNRKGLGRLKRNKKPKSLSQILFPGVSPEEYAQHEPVSVTMALEFP